MDHPLFDRPSIILTIAVLIVSFIVFGTQSADWTGSFFAALMAAGLFWISYIIIRWMVLALRK